MIAKFFKTSLLKCSLARSSISISRCNSYFLESKSILLNKSKLAAYKAQPVCLVKIHTSPPRFREACAKSYSKIWKLERLLSILLLAVVPAAFMYPSKTMDMLLVGVTGLHSYLSLDTIAGEYLRKETVGGFLSKLSHILIFAISLVTLCGLLSLIKNDVGIAEPILKLWSYAGQEHEAPMEEPEGEENESAPLDDTNDKCATKVKDNDEETTPRK